VSIPTLPALARLRVLRRVPPVHGLPLHAQRLGDIRPRPTARPSENDRLELELARVAAGKFRPARIPNFPSGICFASLKPSSSMGHEVSAELPTRFVTVSSS
jgi:hypothetical protein